MAPPGVRGQVATVYSVVWMGGSTNASGGCPPHPPALSLSLSLFRSVSLSLFLFFALSLCRSFSCLRSGVHMVEVAVSPVRLKGIHSVAVEEAACGAPRADEVRGESHERRHDAADQDGRQGQARLDVALAWWWWWLFLLLLWWWW